MKQRCHNPNSDVSKYYGDKGIIVCDEWRNDFLKFYKWSMSNGYQDNLTIDRIDVNGNYTPNNCRWITQAEQLDNTTRTIKIEYNGRVKSLKKWSLELGFNYVTVSQRIKRGIPFHEAINMAPYQRNYKLQKQT